MKPKMILIALALIGAASTAQADLIVDRPPDQRGITVSRHYASIDPSVPLNTFFGYSYIGLGVSDIPGYRLTQLQLYMGSYSHASSMDATGGINDHGEVLGAWHAHLGGFAVDPPFLDPFHGDFLAIPLVTVPVAVATTGVGRIESDVPEAEGVVGDIMFGRVRSNANEPFIETDCDESWVMPPRDCQTRDGDWALAYRAVYTQVSEPSGNALLVLFLAGAWLGMVWWRR